MNAHFQSIISLFCSTSSALLWYQSHNKPILILFKTCESLECPCVCCCCGAHLMSSCASILEEVCLPIREFLKTFRNFLKDQRQATHQIYCSVVFLANFSSKHSKILAIFWDLVLKFHFQIHRCPRNICLSDWSFNQALNMSQGFRDIHWKESSALKIVYNHFVDKSKCD